MTSHKQVVVIRNRARLSMDALTGRWKRPGLVKTSKPNGELRGHLAGSSQRPTPFCCERQTVWFTSSVRSAGSVTGHRVAFASVFFRNGKPARCLVSQMSLGEQAKAEARRQ
ncbi:hypothetical protein D918_01315 [Trichuris suis]|nr:hypothetical protein D918_01315 [Trichuris suis]